MKKRIFALVMSVCMLISMMPMHAHATETEHTHSWNTVWSANEDYHWHDCLTNDCTVTDNAQKDSYGAHNFSTYTHKCDTCPYVVSHTCTGGTATCKWLATCTLCGYSYGTTNSENHQNRYGDKIDETSHRIMCSCGHVFVESETHNWSDWHDDTDGTQYRTCVDCYYAETREAPHSHAWSTAWTNSDTHHWHECSADGCGVTDNSSKDGYAEHVYVWGNNGSTHWQKCSVCSWSSTAAEGHQYDDDSDASCNTCGYTRSVHTHSFSTATCTTPATCSCGTTKGDVDKSNHVGGTEIRNAVSAGEFTTGYTGDTHCKGCGDKLADGKTIPATHVCSFSTATCTTPATCSCGTTTGDVDKSNHTGGTEIRNAVAAGEFTEGYTGDTHCKGCGDKLADGETIPATHVCSYDSYDYDRNGHWRVCSCGATASAEDHNWYIYKKTASKHYWRCDCGNDGWGNEHFDNNDTGKCDDCGYAMEHVHDWASAWTYNDTHHWHECETGNCTVTSDTNKSGYGAHNLGDDYVCDDCSYVEPLEIIPDKTSLTGNGTINFTVNRIVSDIVCSDEFLDSYISGGRQTWSFQMKRNITVDLTFTVHHNGETAFCTVSFVQDPNALILTPSTTSLIGNGAVKLTGNKDIVKIDCSNISYDEDISGSGRNWEFVMDKGAEVSLRFEATSADGETDICRVEFISSSVLIYIDESTRVEFVPGDGVTLPEDAEIVVENHTATLAPIGSLVGMEAVKTVVLEDENILVAERTSFTYNGVTYEGLEFIVIDGVEYFLINANDNPLDLIRTTDGWYYAFHKGNGQLEATTTKRHFEIPTNKRVSINGVTYDVKCIYNVSGADDDDLERWALYYDGEPVGEYYPNLGRASFYEGYDPASLLPKQDENDLGTVTTGENPAAGLNANTSYDVSVIGAQDISITGAADASGTVTQTFDVPVQFVGNSNVTFVAVHDPNPYAKELEEVLNRRNELLKQRWSGKDVSEELERVKERYREVSAIYDRWENKNAKISHDFGDVTLSEDGKTLTATYTVDSFSPFIVYAFVEADEPELKTLSAAIVEGEAASAVPTHTVVRGENLTDIARMYGCTVDEIVALNGDLIENPSQIYVGWVLVIPGE